MREQSVRVSLAGFVRGRAGVCTLSRDAAQELLRRRYAAGEIDEEEYWRRQAGLT